MRELSYTIAIVVPVHIQPTVKWVKCLKRESKNATVIIVDDSDGKVKLPKEWRVYDYAKQKEMLPDDYDLFEPFHKSSACRNFGHWLAYKEGFDIIIALDSDCDVPKAFIKTHVQNLLQQGCGWVNPLKNVGWFPRGYPYYERTRKIVLSMGLWSHELDVNGLDRVTDGKPPKSPEMKKSEVAHGIVPLCGMNFACWARAIPGFLFLPNYDTDDGEHFRRYDDIWGGYIFQKLMQKQKDMIIYGLPTVYHDTIIDAEDDAEKEQMGVSYEEFFYKMVDNMVKDITPGSYASMFSQFSKKSVIFKGTPFEKLIPALEFWAKLYEPKR